LRLTITGGSGKLARYLVPQIAVEHEVKLYDKHRPEHENFPWIQGEITDRDKLRMAFRDSDAVVHLAALRSRFNHLPVKVMETNVMGTFWVLEAARGEGVKRVIFSSSDAALGIAQSQTGLGPEYLPINEKHPLKPQDAYGISKMIGEEMCHCHAAGYDMDIIALRFSNIFCPGDESVYLDDAQDPSLRYKSLWAWVHVYDAVNAISCALKSDLGGFEVFHIAAEDVCLSNPDVPQLISTYFPQTPTDKSFSSKESLIDCSKAKRILKFQPHRSFDSILTSGRSHKI
jgi:nucleoside-diphosphate-sugar epimerase